MKAQDTRVVWLALIWLFRQPEWPHTAGLTRQTQRHSLMTGARAGHSGYVVAPGEVLSADQIVPPNELSVTFTANTKQHETSG
ncbi:MAG: hypothetical protein M1546_23915 [Chloroflexi bacterium]|nr:hypothetical protein [Chloroflexota bacterium]